MSRWRFQWYICLRGSTEQDFGRKFFGEELSLSSKNWWKRGFQCEEGVSQHASSSTVQIRTGDFGGSSNFIAPRRRVVTAHRGRTQSSTNDETSFSELRHADRHQRPSRRAQLHSSRG